MNSHIRITLINCLAILILAGFFPLLITTSQVEAGPGDKIQGDLSGSVTCFDEQGKRVSGGSGSLSLSAEKIGDKVNGSFKPYKLNELVCSSQEYLRQSMTLGPYTLGV